MTIFLYYLNLCVYPGTLPSGQSIMMLLWMPLEYGSGQVISGEKGNKVISGKKELKWYLAKRNNFISATKTHLKHMLANWVLPRLEHPRCDIQRQISSTSRLPDLYPNACWTPQLDICTWLCCWCECKIPLRELNMKMSGNLPIPLTLQKLGFQGLLQVAEQGEELYNVPLNRNNL